MADHKLKLTDPSCLHLVSAFLAMESSDVLISLARICGGGSITEAVQSFIWDHCISKADEKCHGLYLKRFLKKLILEVESESVDVLDELYEHYAFYMTSLKDDDAAKGNSRVLKQVSFLFPDGGSEVSSCPKSRKLVVPLQCSLNMLEGDTGCSIWPSSLFMSEFILTQPEIFLNKSCFEVGSGVGLVGICLAHVKASKVVLTDGDFSCLANMKLNLELNQLSLKTDLERTVQDTNLVQCMHLPWEYAPKSELQDFTPDIVLGADVIYDPSCLPHLIGVLSVLLNHKRSYSHKRNDYCQVSLHGYTCIGGENACHSDATSNGAENWWHASEDGPVAYIASVIRSIDTFSYFLTLARPANLTVRDVTENIKMFDLLPYMHSYQRSCVRLFIISSLCK